jgi:negative regulator of genetic competence, sporulation and motility
MQAIKQLQASGEVRESDSAWRSNVVLVPKPTGKDEDRENTNASKLTGDQNFSKLYRICLDFRELNTCLQFPQQTSFTTVDEILYKLKNKVVISMDISSAFFIIPQ